MSLTNRYLILAALAQPDSDLKGWLRRRDTLLMIEALRGLGAGIEEDADVPHSEPTDLTEAAPAATRENSSAPISIDCGLAGPGMRFVPPVAALTGREVVLDGDEQARVRPMTVTVDSLSSLGAAITSTDGLLPLTIHASSQLRGGHL